MATRSSKPRSSLSRRVETCFSSLDKKFRASLRSFAEAYDSGDILRPRARTPLMMAAIEKLAQASAAADVESADAFGGVELVAGKRKKVDVLSDYIDGDFATGLDGVRVEIDFVFVAMRPISSSG